MDREHLLQLVIGDLLAEPDEGLLHDRLRERQDLLDDVVSEIKVRRAELIAGWVAAGKPLSEIAEERGYGGYQRVQKVLAQTAEARAQRAAQLEAGKPS
ncbi:hypothetical protein [Catellatospora sp. NPDC049609]|uniref:hypothetical protein n=1 Tax=Catellatospora sp. NPDC049609 TaxID=3155505 RepID=UPI00342572BB